MSSVNLHLVCYIIPMSKRLLILVAILLTMFNLSAVSISGNKLENTFESEKNLALFDFTKIEEGEEDFLDNTHFYLQTMAQGDEIYTWFGHSGLVVVNEKYGFERCFDWGVFAFSPTFYIDFIFGRLYYSLMVTNPNYSISQAEGENRELSRRELNIPREAKRGVINFLNYNALDENSTYLYHHYNDNCATRIRDIYNAATSGSFRKWAESIETNMSYRDYTTKLMGRSFIVNWTLNFLQGPSIDKKLNLYQACFLPHVLDEAIEKYTQNDKNIIVQGKETKISDKNLVLESATVALIISMILIWAYSKNKRIWALLMSILLLFFSILSSVLLFMMCFSNHDVTYFNENIIFLNPSLFLALGSTLTLLFSKKKREAKLCLSVMKISFVLTLSLLILKGLFMTVFIQDNIAQIIFMLIIYLSSFILKRP